MAFDLHDAVVAFAPCDHYYPDAEACKMFSVQLHPCQLNSMSYYLCFCGVVSGEFTRTEARNHPTDKTKKPSGKSSVRKAPTRDRGAFLDARPEPCRHRQPVRHLSRSSNHRRGTTQRSAD